MKTILRLLAKKATVFIKKEAVKFRNKFFALPYTAVSRKIVGKSARDNPGRYCGWFCLPCSPKEIEIMAREATDICSRVSEWKATKVGSTATVVRISVLIISHITFRECHVHIFSDNLSQNSCVSFSTVPEKHATCMFCLSIAVCCPFHSLTVTLGNRRQCSGPKSDNASFNWSRLPTR